jgi:ABC-type antimicrobial peptide transport system permease subunit
MTIVGIVADAAYGTLRNPPRPTMYLPLAQWDFPLPPAIALSIRSATVPPDALARTVANRLVDVDRNLAFTFRTLADQVDASIRQEQMVAVLAGFFGGLSLLLAAVGLYGVAAYVVSRRRLELGIRIALGASPSGVVWLVTSRVALLVTIGLGLGAFLSLWASQFVATLLYGLQPHDPATFAAAILVLVTIATVAAGLPAWRASRLNPAVVLRAD